MNEKKVVTLVGGPYDGCSIFVSEGETSVVVRAPISINDHDPKYELITYKMGNHDRVFVAD